MVSRESVKKKMLRKRLMAYDISILAPREQSEVSSRYAGRYGEYFCRKKHSSISRSLSIPQTEHAG